MERIYFCLVLLCITQVHSQEMIVSSENLVIVAKEFLELSLPWASGTFECQFLGGIEKEISIPRPQKNMKIIPRLPSETSYKGKVIVELLLIVDNRQEKKISLPFHVRVYQNVLLTKRFLPKHTSLTEKEFYTYRTEITHLGFSPITKIEEIQGKRNKNSLRANHILTQEDMEEIPLMLAGSNVMLHLEAGPLKITILARVLDNGKKGDVIRVVNLSSQKILKAKVLNESFVSPVLAEGQYENK